MTFCLSLDHYFLTCPTKTDTEGLRRSWFPGSRTARRAPPRAALWPLFFDPDGFVARAPRSEVPGSGIFKLFVGLKLADDSQTRVPGPIFRHSGIKSRNMTRVFLSLMSRRLSGSRFRRKGCQCEILDGDADSWLGAVVSLGNVLFVTML